MDAKQFFLIRHAPVHAEMIENVLNHVTDEQSRISPIKGVNTIAWLLWHMARAEDLALSHFVARRPQLFFEESWARQLNVPCTDFGVEMTDNEVCELSDQINLEALKAYWTAVEQRTRLIVEDLSPEMLDEVNDPEYIRQVVRGDGMFRPAGMWGENYWVELPDRSKGYFLGNLGLTHNWLHYAEALVTLSLLGKHGA